jgi:acyl carrier protein
MEAKVEAREKVLEILEENGLYVDPKSAGEDMDLREYILDSLQFMSFIVEVENKLNLEIPDEILVYDNLASLNGLSSILESIADGTYIPQLPQGGGDAI